MWFSGSLWNKLPEGNHSRFFTMATLTALTTAPMDWPWPHSSYGKVISYGTMGLEALFFRVYNPYNQSCPFGKNRAGSWLIPSIIKQTVFKGVSEETPLFSSTNQWEKDIYANNYGEIYPLSSLELHSQVRVRMVRVSLCGVYTFNWDMWRLSSLAFSWPI